MVKHYGDEWAAANHREMLARRYHIICGYTGCVLQSAHVIAHANDIVMEHADIATYIVDTHEPQRDQEYTTAPTHA